jgi:hypothetical protein
MAYGMPADDVAAAVLKGVDDGAFLIVTHGHVRRIAHERFEAINEAFDNQAPDATDDRYEIGKVSERIRAERAAAKERSSPQGDAGP